MCQLDCTVKRQLIHKKAVEYIQYCNYVLSHAQFDRDCDIILLLVAGK